MNILLLYPKQPGTTAQYCEKSLRKKHNVETFDLLQTPNHQTILGKSICKGKNIDVSNVLKRCNEKPDMVIEIDGPGSHHLKGYKNLGIPTAYWAIDSHLKLNFQKNIALDFDYVFVTQKDYVDSFKEVTDNVFWLPLAADPDIHKTHKVNKLFDIGFVGSKNPKLHPKRVQLLDMLSKKYDVLAVENIWGENVAKVYNQSKIGFNKSILGDLNMRVFEVMSCGTMLLTDKINNGINDLFKDRKHLVLYIEEDIDELVQYYLENEDEREKIAQQGQKEVHERHTYDNRMDRMLSVLGYKNFRYRESGGDL